jgi:putative Holliday junction resolvase
VDGDRLSLIGIDVGERRVGLAASDPTGTIASPFRTVERGPRFWRDLALAVSERQPRLAVIGLPRRLDGTEGPAAMETRRFATELARRLHVEVEFWDERLTTKEAERSLITQGVRRAGRRRQVDAVAASLMLQAYLDAHRRLTSPRSGRGLADLPPDGEAPR